ncbi:hypothetical protein [Microbacterium sp. NPDC056234]|uniref:hypothetical protein n=1 Tax=Microbacterium sp. NPDC056234 TaxID=3345757 RepID=UPI0035D595CB
MTGQHLDGEHDLPATFSSAMPLVRPRSRRRRAIWVVVASALILIVGAGIHAAANLHYDDSLVAFQDAGTVAENRRTALASDADELDTAADAAAGIAAADSGTLMTVEVRQALDATIAEIETTASDADAATAASFPDAGVKPTWTWELFAESARLADEKAALQERTDRLESLSQDVTDARESVEETAIAAAQAAAAAAADLEAAHVNARNPEIIAMRTAAAVVAGIAELDDEATVRYTELESAAAAMLESERAELAEKAGPLYDSRVEIEAFARSLAPDVLLDFDWAPTVPGYDGPSHGGWTTWWYGDPGYSTIALSDYIADSWPAEWAKALVAHEVGHAISVKCEALYDASDQDTIEAWATAWAISMGFNDPANGTDVYGAPPRSLIDAAAGCR